MHSLLNIILEEHILNKLRKILSVILCLLVIFSFTSCHFSTPQTVVSVNGTDIPAGIYLLYQFDAYNTASSAYSDELYKAGEQDISTENIDIFDVTIEGVSGEEWIKNETDRLLKQYVYITVAHSEDSTISAEDIDTAIRVAQDSYDNEYSKEIYEANGIGRQSYVDYYVALTTYYNLLANYTEEQREEININDAQEYMDSKYKQISALSLPTTNAEGAELDDAGKAQIQEIADTLQSDLQSGQSMDELAPAALQEAFEICGLEYSEDVLAQYNTTSFVIDDVNYYFDSETVATIMASSIGDAGQVAQSTMPLVYSIIPNYTDDEHFETNYYDSIVSEMCQNGFDEMVLQETSSYEVVEYDNARSIYSAKNIVI